MSYQLLALSGTKKQWIDSINSACKTLQETKCTTPIKNKLHLSLHCKSITDTPPVQPITPPEQRTPISETNDIAVEFMKKNNLRSICEDVENCPAVANSMVTPLRGDKSPSLMLRNGENVSRLMIERTPEPKEGPKISRVWHSAHSAAYFMLCSISVCGTVQKTLFDVFKTCRLTDNPTNLSYYLKVNYSKLCTWM